MKVESAFIRESGEYPLPARIAIPLSKPTGRPRVEYRLRVESEDDARLVQRRGQPLFALTAKRVTELGYPIRFPTRLVVARSILPLVESSLGTIPFVSEEAARSPRPEDVAIAMLRFDMIGARVLLDRNPDWDSRYLTRRVWEENLVSRATFVRFFDVLPFLPKEGEAISRTALERKIRKNPAQDGR